MHRGIRSRGAPARGANRRQPQPEVHTLYVIEAGGSPARRRASLKKPDIRGAVDESRALLAELARLRPQVEAIGVRFKTVVVYLGKVPPADLRAFAGRPNLEAVVSNAATTARLAAAGVDGLPALVTPTSRDERRPAYEGLDTILDLYLGAVADSGGGGGHGGGYGRGRQQQQQQPRGRAAGKPRKPRTREIDVEDYLQQQIGHPDDDMDDDDYGDEGMDSRDIQRRAADLEAARAAKQPRKSGGGGGGGRASDRPAPVIPRVDDGPESRFSREDIDDFDLEDKFSAGVDDFDDDMLNDYLQDAMDGF